MAGEKAVNNADGCNRTGRVSFFLATFVSSSLASIHHLSLSLPGPVSSSFSPIKFSLSSSCLREFFVRVSDPFRNVLVLVRSPFSSAL